MFLLRSLAGLGLSLVISLVHAGSEPVLAGGKLLIAGGALQSDNRAVYRAFIDSLPQPAGDRIAVIPLASGHPQKSAQAFRDDLIRYGVAAARVVIVPLAVRDDPATAGVDESRWHRGAYDSEVLKLLQGVGGIWFTGGDQMRIATAMLDNSGAESPLLQRLRQRLAAGAIIGGSSAGAAIMSNPMIAAGDSLSALTRGFASSYAATGQQERGRLFLHPGLGFFEYGLVDQHFDRKARLGRLALALTRMPAARRLGFGVDENSAMLVSLRAQSFKTLGPGTVTVVDGRRGSFAAGGGRLLAKDLRLHILSDGDIFNIDTGQALIADDKNAVVGEEAFAYRPHSGGGIAVGNQRIDQILGFDLLDNRLAARIERYSFDAEGRGFIYRFRQTGASAGYWRYDSARRDQYTALNILFDILPVDVKVTPVE